LNPTLLLNTAVQSARVREWQVLPGRTHPVMTGRGGAEGYLFTGVRVVPAVGRVEARGKFARRKIVDGEKDKETSEAGTPKKKVKLEADAGADGNGEVASNVKVKEEDREEGGTGLPDAESRDVQMAEP